MSDFENLKFLTYRVSKKIPSWHTGCPKKSLDHFQLELLKSKGLIAKSNTYLETRNLRNFFDTKHDPIGFSKIF